MYIYIYIFLWKALLLKQLVEIRPDEPLGLMTQRPQGPTPQAPGPGPRMRMDAKLGAQAQRTYDPKAEYKMVQSTGSTI